MSKNKIWFAIVGITPLKGNEILTEVKRAYVNVACISENEKEFKLKLKDIFNHHRFEIVEIDDIETEDDLKIDNPDNAEKLKLLDEVKEGYQFAWGTFHVFDE